MFINKEFFILFYIIMKQVFYLFLVLAISCQVCSDEAEATRIDYLGASQYQGKTLDEL